jgi:hypothetical protein
MFDKILQIGINYYGTEMELSGCINDVENLQEYFKSTLDCSKTEFKTLRDDSKDGAVYPSTKNIIEAFQWLTKDAKDGSRLFIHYSGHGSSMPDMYRRDEADGRDELICPAKGPMIPDDVLRQHLVDPLPKGCKMWALFDCCHSGTILDLKFNYRILLQPRHKDWRIVGNNKVRRSNGDVILISGCRDNQYSADAKEPDSLSGVKEFQGAMTYAFLKTMRQLNAMGKKPEYRTIMKRMCTFLKARGYDQIPQLSSGKWLNLEECFEP